MKGRWEKIDPEKMKLRMADLCMRSEQCSHDVEEKLRRSGVSEDKIFEIVVFLRENKFIDDVRFAGSFARDKVRFSGWGRNKIRASLRLKRIRESEIDSAIESVDPEEYMEALMRGARAKGRTLDLEEYADRAKLMRYLGSRGFTGSEAGMALKNLLEE